MKCKNEQKKPYKTHKSIKKQKRFLRKERIFFHIRQKIFLSFLRFKGGRIYHRESILRDVKTNGKEPNPITGGKRK